LDHIETAAQMKDRMPDAHRPATGQQRDT